MTQFALSYEQCLQYLQTLVHLNLVQFTAPYMDVFAV